MDTDSFIIHFKSKDFYKDIANYVKKWFDTSNYRGDDKTTSKRYEQENNWINER